MGFELDNCCFCIELRTGSLIIGYLSLVGTTILTLLSIFGAVGLGAVLGNASDMELNPEQQNELKAVGTIALIIVIIVLIFRIVNLIFVIVLLVGLHKEKRGHVKAYIVYNCIYLVISTIMFIVVASTGGAAGAIVRELISIALGIYFLIVIRSYWVKMNDATKRPAIYNTA